MKTSFFAYTLSLLVIISDHAVAFKTSSQSDAAYRNATFKICSDYMTLVESGDCPAPSIRKSSFPIKRQGAFGTETFATYYGRMVFTPTKKTAMGVSCQVGLYACATIKDTGFDGGDVACRNTCSRQACQTDPYTNYACRILSNKTKGLGGRKVCSKDSVKACLQAKPAFTYAGKSYDKALSSADMDLVKNLKEEQSDKQNKIYTYVLGDLEIIQQNLSQSSQEFNKGEVSFSEWPEVIEEGDILFEQKMAEKKGEASGVISRLVKEFMKNEEPVHGPEDDKLHQSYWSNTAIGDTIHDIRSLTRSLTDVQSYELKKMVTDATTTGINAEKRAKMLAAVIKLAKAHYGKHAASYGLAFKESKKVNLWRKILQSIPFLFTVEDRIKVITDLIPLSEYQLLQVVHYDKFHSIYPDELPNKGNLTDHIENVRKLDVRYPITTPDYMKGIELPEVALDELIGNSTYQENVREKIINYYKKETKPDTTSVKGKKIYRKYTPSLKIKAFLRAVNFLTDHTKDFESRTFITSKADDSKKLEVIQRLLSYSYRKLSFIKNAKFLKALKKNVPHEDISWLYQTGKGKRNFTVYDSYEKVLDLLDKEFKGK